MYRKLVADFIGVQDDEVVFVPNTTHGINTILRNFEWREGDIIIGGMFTVNTYLRMPPGT